MAVRHFVIKHGGHRIKFGGHCISTTTGSVSITVNNRSTNASFSQSTYFAPVNSTLTIPITYVDGADETCISSTSGTVTSAGIQLTVGVADTTITVSDTKVKVAVSNQFTTGIASLTPSTQFVAFNSTASVAIQYNSGYSASDVEVSVGQVSGNTWSIPVTTTPVTANITEWAKVLVQVTNQFTEGVSALNPLSQYVHQNTTATVAVTFNSGYTSADVKVSDGSITGTTWSIPVATSPISATLTEATSMSVHIGAHDYPVVQIGNLLWTAENLYEPLSSEKTGSNYNYCWAHNEPNNPNGYGMLYSINAIHNNTTQLNYLKSLLPTGWRIPTYSDYSNLKSNCSTFKDLMSKSSMYNGNDKYGFCGLDTGQAYTSSGGSSSFEYSTFQVMVSPDNNPGYDTLVISHSSSSYYLRFHSNGTSRMIALRLCKDA